MKILSIVSTYAPHMIGGAEVSTMNAIRWLRDQGHEVAAVATAQDGESELFGEPVDGVRVWRIRWPREHTHLRHSVAKPFKKLIWHLQDLFDPRNRRLLGNVLDAYNPDIVLIRVMPGIGYNSLYEVAKRDIPAICFMHDMNLVCAKSDMFLGGRNCERQCSLCKTVSKLRFAAVSSIPRVSFCSPSRAILKIASRYLPLANYKATSIMNPNKYATPTIAREAADHPRFLYVGRLHASKGVSILLDAAASLAINHKFTLTVVGSGPDEEGLKTRFSGEPWCTFSGQVPHAEVANYMANSDVLCVPSIWLENSPGVVIHALSIGLPVIGSDQGGIPEYIVHEENGLLVEPGDVDAWRNALLRILNESTALERWRLYARNHAAQYEQGRIGRDLLALIEQTIAQPKSTIRHRRMFRDAEA